MRLADDSKKTMTHAALEKELTDYVTRPDENARIRGIFERAAPRMEEIAYNLLTGDQHAVAAQAQQALHQGFSANSILDDGLIAGMAVVGVKFRDGAIFVPEVLIAARAMKAGMALLEPILTASGVEPIGTVVMGTVKGDL